MNQEKIGADGQERLLNRRRSEIPSAERVQILQGKLYQKAKQEREYRFYILYDKMCIPYMLREAWRRVKANGGVAGVDGITIEDIEKRGVEEYLRELGEDLRKQTYRPKAVRRVMIPKANGGERPLGIPTVRDRIAQTVCKMILEPIFEADFESSSYGYRPGKSSKDAIKATKENLEEGKTEIYEIDLSNYFDTIPHNKLYIAVRSRIADPRMLKLIDKWLKAPIYEDGKYKGGKKNKVGTPQGGVISPLLANIYLHLLDRIVSSKGNLFNRHKTELIRYADDFVLMGREIPDEVIEKLEQYLKRMELKINRDKTRLINAREQSFDFLGFTVRYDNDTFGRDKKYWNIIPGKKAEKKNRDRIDAFLKKHGHSPAQKVAEGLNEILRGWLNYFVIKGVSYPAMSQRRLRHYLCERLWRYYNRKSQRKSSLFGQQAFEVLVNRYKLIDPTNYSKLAHL
jgi:group II intron reverse transcriptase/maturase